ncbi:MAG: hypothetical protein V1753_11875 [Pseudomonadota bacterium]
MKKTRLGKWMFGAIFCFVLLMTVQGAEAKSPAQASVRIERVALFKNGLGFFVASGSLPEGETTVRIGQLPVPAYGTFWVGYPEDVKVRCLVTALEDIEERHPAQNVGQLLRANPGVSVVLRTGPGEKDVVEGVIRKTVTQESMPEPPSPYLMSIRRTIDPYGRTWYNPTSANTVLIDTQGGLVALNEGSILRADFAHKEIAESVIVSARQPYLRMELEQPAHKGVISVSYLARGATWFPGYQIDISDAENALLTAQALIVNEAADLEHVTLDLVTGFPNIKFGEILSPVAMNQSLADFLNSLTSGRTETRQNSRSRMMSQQAVMSNAPVFDSFEGIPMPSYSTAAQGTESEDLFLYPVKDFSLRRGETAYLPLFTAKMPYRHIYTWKIEDCLNAEDSYHREEERADGRIAEEVWHCCRLKNTLNMPLTTASAQFVSRGQFNGQDLCYYTAPGGETTIRINRAMNILADQREYEVERKRNAASFYNSSYDLVKVRGELKLQSRLDKDVPVEITKELSGEVLDIAKGAKDIMTAKGLKKVNQKHVLTWAFDLKAGEEQTLFYVYQVYIRP